MIGLRLLPPLLGALVSWSRNRGPVSAFESNLGKRDIEYEAREQIKELFSNVNCRANFVSSQVCFLHVLHGELRRVGQIGRECQSRVS